LVKNRRFEPTPPVFDAVLLGRLFDRVDLIKPVSNVRPSVRPSTKSVFDFNEI